MAGPQNAIVGDGNFGTDIPETDNPEADLTRETNMARYSKEREFKIMKEAMEGRIKYWKKFVPGSDDPVAFRTLGNDERGWRTLVADVLIEEFQGVIGAYEAADGIVKDAKKNARRKNS